MQGGAAGSHESTDGEAGELRRLGSLGAGSNAGKKCAIYEWYFMVYLSCDLGK